MRVLAPHPDLIVFISGAWQTTCTAVRGGGEGFVIDSPVFPDELDAVPRVLEQAGFPVSGLLCTHGDWDHLLGRLAYPALALGCGESTARRLGSEPGAAQRRLREFDEEHYVERPGPLALAGVQELPVPGKLGLGETTDGGRELELHPAIGHSADGTAFVIPWLGTLVCGDYLSPVEIPMISVGGSLDAYRETLERFAGLLPGIDTVVPGHGGPITRAQGKAILDEDRAYLDALRAEGAGAALPAGRRTREQRHIHERNAAAATG